MAAKRRRRRKGKGGGPSGWVVALAGGILIGGLVLGAHFFDESLEDGPASTLIQDDQVVEPPSAWNRVRVEVLNGAGTPGLAAQARDYLREEGFDVVYYGNAPSFDQEVTRVMARTDSGPAARAVAGRLGITAISVEPDSTLFVDVTVVLGLDWPADTLDADPEDDHDEAVAGSTPWWDLRRMMQRHDD